MEAKTPVAWRLHPMNPRPTPYRAPCGAILNNAVAALAHAKAHGCSTKEVRS